MTWTDLSADISDALGTAHEKLNELDTVVASLQAERDEAKALLASINGSALVEELGRAERQRDELVEALREIESTLAPDGDYMALRIAREALAPYSEERNGG